MNQPAYSLEQKSQHTYTVTLSGHWTRQHSAPSIDEIRGRLQAPGVTVCFLPDTSLEWDSTLIACLLSLHRKALAEGCRIELHNLPEDIGALLNLATAVPPADQTDSRKGKLSQSLLGIPGKAWKGAREFFEFTGEISLSLVRLLLGKSDTRFRDVIDCLDQSGPAALPIVTLLSFLVGMILAYLGTVQLRQLGAEVYVANLVGLGMVREMGALMTAVIMAGRTGAAYAAQLGSMQVNEEIDALVTLGIKPVDYLVVPRMLALVFAMPLLTLYSNVLGMLGGGAVALGMDITFTQYIHQLSEAFTGTDIVTGLLKSLVFGALISFAGCQAGLQCGRSSAAVGQATTRAVVSAIVYLVVADAGLNILFFELGV